jgi:hypothetical protein
VSYNPRPYLLSADALYSSGLATGFAHTHWLPEVLQINESAERTLSVPGLLPVSIRVSLGSDLHHYWNFALIEYSW